MARPAGKVRLFALALSVLCLALWAQPAPALDAAATLLKKMEKELKKGNTLEACRLARGFAKYEEEGDNPAYEKAKNLLLEHGISVTNPLASYTLLKIVKLQNKTEVKRSATRSLPKAGLRRNFRDAWGKPLRIELVAQEGFLYVIRSSGPDRKNFTSDDLLVGVREDQTAGLKREGGVNGVGVKIDLKSTAQRSGRKSLLGSQINPKKRQMDSLPGGMPASSAQGSPRRYTPPKQKIVDGEVEVSLDDMLK